MLKTAWGAGVSDSLEKQLANTEPVPELFTYYKNRDTIQFGMIDEVIRKQRLKLSNKGSKKVLKCQSEAVFV